MKLTDEIGITMEGLSEGIFWDFKETAFRRMYWITLDSTGDASSVDTRFRNTGEGHCRRSPEMGLHAAYGHLPCR